MWQQRPTLLLQGKKGEENVATDWLLIKHNHIKHNTFMIRDKIIQFKQAKWHPQGEY